MCGFHSCAYFVVTWLLQSFVNFFPMHGSRYRFQFEFLSTNTNQLRMSNRSEPRYYITRDLLSVDSSQWGSKVTETASPVPTALLFFIYT